MNELTDNELIALHKGIVKVNIGVKGCLEVSRKLVTELNARGYEIEYKQLPKRPYDRKKYYEWQYNKIK